MDETQLARLMHHIVVEILTLHRAGRDLSQACLPRGEGSENKQHTMGATIVLGGDGASSLEFNSKAVKESILKAIPELELSEQEQTNTSRSIAPSLVNELSQYSNGHLWMDMKLRDMNVKLAVSSAADLETSHTTLLISTDRQTSPSTHRGPSL